MMGEATNGEEAQRLCRMNRPDILLLDLHMPGPSVIETIAYMRQHCPQTRVLLLTTDDDATDIHRMIEAGAAGCLLDETPLAVVQAIRTVMQGGIWFARQVIDKRAQPEESLTMTQREREVLKLVAHGRNNQQIAEELCIAEITVRFHLRNIYVKLNMHSRTQAVRWAMQHGLGR